MSNKYWCRIYVLPRAYLRYLFVTALWKLKIIEESWIRLTIHIDRFVILIFRAPPGVAQPQTWVRIVAGRIIWTNEFSPMFALHLYLLHNT